MPEQREAQTADVDPASDTAGATSGQDDVQSAEPPASDGKPTVVGIGASAGGLAALKTFFGALPEDSGLAFVVVVHLSPEHKSHLPELLQTSVGMPVLQVQETTRLEPNQVYVIPPNRNLNTIDTHLRLTPLEEERADRAPIDHFFRTLANTHDGNSIAIVLTGTGSDGALGVKEIKAHGGLTIVQDPVEAEYDGMPQSAIMTGAVDLVLPLTAIPEAILGFASVFPSIPVPDESERLDGDASEILHKIFTLIRGREFNRYKQSTILRRIRPVVLDVRAPTDDSQQGFLAVVFEDRGGTELIGDAAPLVAGEMDTLVSRLQHSESERDSARQRLQAIVEEYETSQEELKASNEELQSANEELRSTLEELETSKEELQSMNEELQTVNQENRHKVEELAQLSADLQNLLTATPIATLFLDRELRILRFTPALGELFNVRATDRGRPISDLTHRLGYDDLRKDASAVLRDLIPIERELRDDSGRWFLTRLLAYRSTDDRIEGVVITFVDITSQKQAEDAWRLGEERLRHVADAVPNVMFAADEDGVVRFVSGQTRRVMGVDADDLLGTAMWPQLIHPDDRGRVQQAWEEARDEGRWFEDRYRLAGANGELAVMVRASPMHDDSGRISEWFGTVTDVSRLVETEEALKRANDTLERRVYERTTQVRELALSLSRAEHEERRRLGQVLHDDLQQRLYGVQLKLSFAREEAQEGDIRRALDALSQGEARLKDAIEITRTLTVDLSPPLLDDDGLAESLHWLASHMSDLHGLDVRVSVDESAQLDSREIGDLLLQATRELLFNVAKHAGTREALIGVRRDDGDIELIVSDRGAGFALDEYDEQPAGIGLKSVRERVELLGGSVAVMSEPGEGTQVVVRVPATESATMGSRKGVDST